jgi:hypothetical protein
MHVEQVLSRVRKIRACIRPELDSLDVVTDEDSAAAMAAAGIAGSEEELLGHVLQDKYFRIRRIPELSRRAFAAQCGATAERILLDLPFSVLGIEEYTAILRAMAMSWSTLAEEGVPHGVAEPKTQVEIPVTPDDWRTFWQLPMEQEKRARQVAQYRWVTGHHFLDICFIFCRKHLSDAISALNSEDPEGSARSLRMSTIFLRGTTAAMRYAANFPARIYNEITRPSMDEMGAPLSMGFSGTQNADYIKFQVIKDSLLNTVKNTKEMISSEKFGITLEAFKEFREVYLADMEQHILIAASKVGTDTSLMQKASRKSMPTGIKITDKSGADILRELVDIRRSEFEF